MLVRKDGFIERIGGGRVATDKGAFTAECFQAAQTLGQEGAAQAPALMFRRSANRLKTGCSRHIVIPDSGESRDFKDGDIRYSDQIQIAAVERLALDVLRVPVKALVGSVRFIRVKGAP